MSSNKHIVVISGSPKPPGTAASDLLAARTQEILQDENTNVRVLGVRETLTKKKTDEAFAAMAAADALIIIFPLYIFCLPGILMRFLQMYHAYTALRPEIKKGVAVYAVVNCGFPEPEINAEAVRVISRFASAIGAQFRFGVMIGAGGMITMNARPAQMMLSQYGETMARIKAEIVSGSRGSVQNVGMRVRFPRRLYLLMGNMGWRRWIRQNGKRTKDLYAKPYQR